MNNPIDTWGRQLQSELARPLRERISERLRRQPRNGVDYVRKLASQQPKTIITSWPPQVPNYDEILRSLQKKQQ